MFRENFNVFGHISSIKSNNNNNNNNGVYTPNSNIIGH